MELNYELTADDYLAFNTHYYNSSGVGHRQLRSARLLLSVVTPVMVFIAIGLVFGDVVEGAVIAVLTGAGMWLLAPRLVRREVSRTLGRMNRDSGLGVTGPHRLHADEHGVTEVAGGRESTASWAVIDRIDETADHAFVFFGPTQAFVVPKRIDSERFEAFLTEVRERTSDRGKSA